MYNDALSPACANRAEKTPSDFEEGELCSWVPPGSYPFTPGKAAMFSSLNTISHDQGVDAPCDVSPSAGGSLQLRSVTQRRLPTGVVAQRSRSAEIVVGPFPASHGSSPIKVTLHEYPSWETFCALTTEMIITKAGRRIFPCLEVSLEGLEAESKYEMRLWMEPLGDHRYRFVSGNWQHGGRADDVELPPCCYIHPESPNTGAAWMAKTVSFKKAKLTNNKEGYKEQKNHGQLVLNSMHKYRPVFSVTKVSDPDDRDLTEGERVHYVFSFDVTDFIAVTAYQNEKVTKLKISSNPFARAFRNKQDQDLNGQGQWGTPDGLYETGPHFGIHIGSHGDTIQSSGGLNKRPTHFSWSPGDGKPGQCSAPLLSWSPLYTVPPVFSPHSTPGKGDYTTGSPMDVSGSPYPFSSYQFPAALAYPIHPISLEGLSWHPTPSSTDTSPSPMEMPPLHSIANPNQSTPVQYRAVWSPSYQTSNGDTTQCSEQPLFGTPVTKMDES